VFEERRTITSKAKYDLNTDSEKVTWVKAEKDMQGKVKKNKKSNIYKHSIKWGTFCIMDLQVIITSE